MNRIARAAFAAAVSVALLSVAPVAPAGATQAPDARQAATTYKVTAKINKAEVVAGEDIVKIKGRVKPNAAGQKVTLEQRREGRNRWVTSGKAKIKKDGTFLLKDEPHVIGVRYYRVVKPAADGIKAGKSKELKLKVWGWQPLVYRAGAGVNSGVLIGYDTYIGTDYYGVSLVQQTPGRAGYVEWTLGEKCRSLRATYALTDSSATGAVGSVAVTVDGVLRATNGFTTGQVIKDQVIDVTDAFRVRFDMNSTASPVGYAAVGTPEVLCLD